MWIAGKKVRLDLVEPALAGNLASGETPQIAFAVASFIPVLVAVVVTDRRVLGINHKSEIPMRIALDEITHVDYMDTTSRVHIATTSGQVHKFNLAYGDAIHAVNDFIVKPSGAYSSTVPYATTQATSVRGMLREAVNVVTGRTPDGRVVSRDFQAEFAGFALRGPTLYGDGRTWTIVGAKAEVQAGTVLAGQHSSVFVLVHLANGGEITIEGNGAYERLARSFAASLNQASAFYSASQPGQQPPEPDEPGASAADPMDQLRRLAELRDAGVLTEDEFTSKKVEILGRI